MEVAVATVHSTEILFVFLLKGLVALIAGIWKCLLKIRHQIWTTDKDRRQSLEVCARILFPGPRCIPLSCRPGTQQGSVRLDGGDDSAASKELRGTHRLN